MYKFFFIFIFLLFGNKLLFSQQLLVPLNRENSIPIEKKIGKKNIYFHSTSKPFLYSMFDTLNFIDTSSFFKKNINNKRKLSAYLKRKLRKESFIIIDSSDFYLTINPLFNFEIGKNIITDSLAYVNTRGLLIQGNIGHKFSFSTSFYENQARFVNYVNDFINKYSVVPGQGPIKSFKTNDFDFSSASAYISLKPIHPVNIQLGHGKNFFGEGYRSLLLSDNAFNYPYLKLTAENKRIQYTTMYASFINKVSRTFVSEFEKKYATFHFLSYNINSRFNVSFFESIIWQSVSNKQTKSYSIAYLNPIIFLPALIYQLRDSNNVMLGLNMKYKLFNKFSIYTQFAVDDFESLKNNSNIHQKVAYQFGIKSFDIFSITNLNLIIEYNQARPYTYAYENPSQNYSHYNQSLAHPLGANFKETIGILNYRIKNFFIETKINYGFYGEDSLNSNFGKNIFYSEKSVNPSISENNLLQGIKTSLFIKDIKLIFLVNASTNLNVLIGLSDRTINSTISKQNSLYFYIGVRTSLTNFYYDF